MSETRSAVFLEVEGEAADHLYREGSAKASFWEAVVGSSLRAKKRAHVSALADGTRRFEVPLLAAEDALLRSAQLWITSPERSDAYPGAVGALAAKAIRVKLIGLQPQGRALATFTLRFEPSSEEAPSFEAIALALRSWFTAEGRRLAQETLIPFGFTPRAL
jgi:hypothetical protein